jgi:hypothetical protein
LTQYTIATAQIIMKTSWLYSANQDESSKERKNLGSK